MICINHNNVKWKTNKNKLYYLRSISLPQILSRPWSLQIRRFHVCHLLFDFQLPAIIAVINHLVGHAAINADILASDETSLVGAKV